MSQNPSSSPVSSPHIALDDVIAQSNMPPPGPDFFAARRALWLTPRAPVQRPNPPSEALSSRQRLEEVLSAPDAVYNDQIWKLGVDRVWTSLAAGGRLKQRLPLRVLIKIIFAAWIRDQTWPTGATVPESDGESQHYEPPPPSSLNPSALLDPDTLYT
ncbi:hypothetical protein AX16_000996 [Volvariella volvacea WC 439]|nr:hypothetical protein AX16_000996 [Volvariella volvacea WC 439]